MNKLSMIGLVVVPSLTPDNYNLRSRWIGRIQVVVPSLTPDNYNTPPEIPCHTTRGKELGI